MNRKNGSGSGMFMMEMILAVFFFLLCSGICVTAFVKADRMSHLAQDTNQAVVIAENMAEIWKAGGRELLEEKQERFLPIRKWQEKTGISGNMPARFIWIGRGHRLQRNPMYFLQESCLSRKRMVWRRQRSQLSGRGIRSSCFP